MGIRLFLPLLVFCLGLVILRLHAWLASAWRTRVSRQTGKRVQIAGGILLAIGGLGLSALAITLVIESAAPSTSRGSRHTGFDFLGGLFSFFISESENTLGLMTLLSAVLWLPLTACGLLLFLLGGRITRGEATADDGLLACLRFAGWGLFALSVMSLLPLFLFMLAPIPIGILMVTMRRNRRFENQKQLMSLLSLSIQQMQPLPDEIAAFAKGRGGSFRRQLVQLERQIREGAALPDALARVPGLFPQETIDTIRLAAANRTLQTALPRTALLQEARLSKRFEQQTRLTEVLNLLATYLLIFSMPSSFLMYWIVPKYKAIFDGFGMQLPPATITLIAFSDFCVNYFGLIALVLIAVVGALFLWVGDYFNRWPLRWMRPLLTSLSGSLNPRAITQRLLDQMALMTSNHQPLTDGLKFLSTAPSYAGVGNRLKMAAYETEQGGDVWESLRKKRLLTGPECGLLQAGQRMGNLPWTLELIADGIERRSLARLEFVRTSMFTLFLLGLGLLVAWYSIAFFAPLLTLLRNLS